MAEQLEEFFFILDKNLNILFINKEIKKTIPSINDDLSNFHHSLITNYLGSGLYSFVKKNISLTSCGKIPIKYQAELINWELTEIVDHNQYYYLLRSTNKKEITTESLIHNLELVIDNMPCNVYWMDKNCLMLGCNKNVLNMLGLSKQGFIGKSYEELAILCNWTKGLDQKLKNDDLQVIQTQQPIFNMEDPPIPGPNGQKFYFITNRVPLFDKNGVLIGVAGITT